MRLIDADKLKAEIVLALCIESPNHLLPSEKTIYRLINNAPTVSAERKGHWQITDAYPHNVYCSECHKRFAQTHWAVWEDGSLPRAYCPNCGARMDGEQ